MGISAAVRGINWGLVSAPSRRLLALAKRAEIALAQALIGGNYRVTPEGLIVLDAFRLRGEYFTDVRERPDPRVDHNLLVDEGILKMLGVAFYTDVKLASWYVALFNGAATPGNTLKASTFATTMSEITSTSEGYTQATRPVWTPAAPAANVINNFASKASFTIATAASITVQGAGLLSDSTRGGTSGVLASASRFSAGRELFDGETFDVGYQISLTD